MPFPAETRFRSSPALELRRVAELSAGEREAFAELEIDPEFYGILVPRPPLRTNLKSVARPAADLFLRLSTPGTLEATDVAGLEVIDLVLDGILEVETSEGFVSGADALPLLGPGAADLVPHDAVSRLSLDALLHAQDLESDDPRTLTSALYLYNRLPLTPFWRTRFPSVAAILAHVGADRGSLRARLDRDWIQNARGRGWISWASKSYVARQTDDVTYKLYVSVRPERIRDAFETVVRVLAEIPGVPFKMGDDAVGLLRPDKIVAYFRSREELDAAAGELHRELAGCDAHGVPFSAGLDDTGLLSWGVDPPDTERALRWLGRDSWRLWIAKKLGQAMALAKTSRNAHAVAAWQFAVERARRHGVDVQTWTPSVELWSRS